MNTFVDVCLPLPLSDTYTYRVPSEWETEVIYGMRVIVPFGRKKFYTALVLEVHHRQPSGFEVKEIESLCDTRPVLLPTQGKLWQWMARYYLTTIGEIYKAALPSGLRLESETQIKLLPTLPPLDDLSPLEREAVQLLQNEKHLTLSLLAKRLQRRSLLSLLRNGVEKEIFTVSETLEPGYSEKKEIRVSLAEAYADEAALLHLQQQLKRSPKQWKALAVCRALQAEEADHTVSWLRWQSEAKVSPSVLKTLVDKGIIVREERTISRLGEETILETQPIAPLSEAQQQAFDQMQQQFASKEVVLLHGVTSSGKTEVYIHLIQQEIEAGRQVLFLLPEIGLTAQITRRLRKAFGDRLGVYHSKFSDSERVEIWQRMLSDRPYDVLVGVRSSVFLPFQRLGLVIVDEEQETSYKQQEPAPRYHARNVAIVLAHQQGAHVLLGTATPSLESYYNARMGKYGLVELFQRYGDVSLPLIEAVDLKEQRCKRLMKGPFSTPLYEAIREALRRKEQVILFQNRRGFSPLVECESCGWVPRCPHCDVSLTYHKGYNEMVCHYCGHVARLPEQCPACGERALQYRGMGTERIEEEVKYLFPEVRMARMDLDTTRSKLAHDALIKRFEEGKLDLLVGTQMLARGLDFERVSVVAILHADSMIHFPDFRSFERAYQMMTQVAGRAGRRQLRGKVFIQTYDPHHPVIEQVVRGDYRSLYLREMKERAAFHYPPLYRIVVIVLKRKNRDKLVEAARLMASRLRETLGKRVLGPDQPPVGRVSDYYLQKIWIKVEPTVSYDRLSGYLISCWEMWRKEPPFLSLQLYFDVDPL